MTVLRLRRRATVAGGGQHDTSAPARDSIVSAAGTHLSRLPIRGTVLVGAVALAYHFSLLSLLGGLDLQTPLGYLGLVPILAFLIGASTFITRPRLRPIHDRQLDWIVGLAFLAASATIEVGLPSAYNANFWLGRLDLLALPFFAAGLVALLYGVRRLWAVRWAILFLFLAWPVPYETILASAIGSATDISLALVAAIARIVPIVQPAGEGTFLVSHGGGTFAVSVGSACSGINSVVGFLLLGTAWNAVLSGGVLRRIGWLFAGLVVVGALNVARIELIFVAGTLFGAPFAFDVLHPVAGLIVFALGALLMLALARPFGLHAPALERKPDSAAKPQPNDGLAVGPRIRLAAPAAFALLLAATLAIPDGSLASYSTLVDGFGAPQLAAIDPATVVLTGWTGSNPTAFDQATQYFGQHATWERIAFSANAPVPGPGTAYLDVIRTDQAGTLSAYGVEACYSFHGFNQISARAIDVGAGVEAKLASYRSPSGGTNWSLLWWEWPYSAGTETRFERLVLLAPVNGPDAAALGTSPSLATPTAAPTPAAPAAPAATDFTAAEASLTAAGRSIVAQALREQAPPLSAARP